MANTIYRNRIINNIAHAVREASDAAAVEHPGLVGRIRELTIERLLAPMLPAGFQAGTGKVVNNRGDQSNEVDIVIYNGSKSAGQPQMRSPCLAAVRVAWASDSAPHRTEPARVPTESRQRCAWSVR